MPSTMHNASQAERRAHPRRGRNRPLTILVVDDNADMRRVLEYQFKFFGARVVTADDGVEAMQFATLYQPDAIVLDLAMPRMAGWEAAHHIKRSPATRHIPIVDLSGHVFDGAREQALAAGADAFLTKPRLPRDVFEAVVQLVMPERRRRRRPV